MTEANEILDRVSRATEPTKRSAAEAEMFKGYGAAEKLMEIQGIGGMIALEILAKVAVWGRAHGI